MPAVAQADGRQISEKDLMRYREQMYNGVDLHGSQENVPVEEGQTQSVPAERRTVRPEEVFVPLGRGQDEVGSGRHRKFSFEDHGDGTNSFAAGPS